MIKNTRLKIIKCLMYFTMYTLKFISTYYVYVILCLLELVIK